MTEEEQLRESVQHVIDEWLDQDEISPAWVATQAMELIKFPHSLHQLGYTGCHLELRQIARGKLRRQFDPVARAVESAGLDLFPDTLQDRYPRRSDDHEPVYVIRHLMTHEDVEYNAMRMQKAGSALLEHARALRAWDAERDPVT